MFDECRLAENFPLVRPLGNACVFGRFERVLGSCDGIEFFKVASSPREDALLGAFASLSALMAENLVGLNISCSFRTDNIQ